VPLDISIKSNRKHHKTVLYSKSNKNMVGRLLGQFYVVFGAIFSQKHLVTLETTYTWDWLRHLVDDGALFFFFFFKPVSLLQNRT
jgi:hypothetical protein